MNPLILSVELDYQTGPKSNFILFVTIVNWQSPFLSVGWQVNKVYGAGCLKNSVETSS